VPSAYPGSIDSFTAVSNGDTVDPSLPNDHSDSVVAVQSTLGTNPQGSFSTVSDYLNALIQANSLQSGSLLYAADTGSVNALAITISPTPPSYTAGQVFYVLVGNTNTGACTIAVNGQAAVSLVKNGASPLAAGDITAGMLIPLAFDGTNFQTFLTNSASAGTPECANTVNEFRLTLVSGTPIVADDTYAAGTTVYCTPYTGDRIALYDSVPGWQVFTTAELSIDVSGLSAGVYDLFIYNDSGTPTLEIGPAWSDNNTRSTDLAIQDGVYVNSSDATQRYLGTFYTAGGSSSVYVTDNLNGRVLYNAQNRIPRFFVANGNTFTSNSGWSSIFSVPFLQGLLVESLSAWGVALGQGDGSSVAAEISLGLESNGNPDIYNSLAATIGTSYLSCTFVRYLSQVGLDGLALYFQSADGATTVNLLDDGMGRSLSYVTGIVWV
jgi:hypothetical protein